MWDGKNNEDIWYEDGSWHVLYESVDDVRFLDLTGKYRMPDMEWTCIEAYVKFSTNSRIGEVRMWFNGEQMGETHNFQTTQAKYLDTGSDPADLTAMFINYWNSGAPKDQTLWWARPALAIHTAARDDRPSMARDASGFPFIGLTV
jgi:hypothetical protein